MSTENRFEAIIDRFDYADLIPGLDEAGTLDEAWNVVTDWLDEKHGWFRAELDLGDLETLPFEVEVIDTEDEDGARVRDFEYYVLPDEPDDADGEWEYRGCYNSCEYRVCGSIEDGAAWWWIEDCSDLGGRKGCPDRTYTQDTSLIHPELVEEEEEEEEVTPRFTIEINGQGVDEEFLCSLRWMPDLDDLNDADDMLGAVIAYIERGYHPESGPLYDIVVTDNEDGESVEDTIDMTKTCRQESGVRS